MNTRKKRCCSNTKAGCTRLMGLSKPNAKNKSTNLTAPWKNVWIAVTACVRSNTAKIFDARSTLLSRKLRRCLNANGKKPNKLLRKNMMSRSREFCKILIWLCRGNSYKILKNWVSRRRKRLIWTWKNPLHRKLKAKRTRFRRNTWADKRKILVKKFRGLWVKLTEIKSSLWQIKSEANKKPSLKSASPNARRRSRTKSRKRLKKLSRKKLTRLTSSSKTSRKSLPKRLTFVWRNKLKNKMVTMVLCLLVP